MDDALRCLRDGHIAGRSPAFVLMEDDVPVIGGPAICSQMARDICLAISHQRAQARRVLLVPCSNKDSAYAEACQAHLGSSLHRLCVRAEDDGALQEMAAAVRGPSAAGAHVHSEAASISGRSPEESSSGPEHDLCVVIDSLSTLLFLHPPHQVLQLVEELLQCARVSCILATLHTDLHEKPTVSALERAASCVLRVLPLPDSCDPVPGQHTADFELQALLKQRTGRVRVVTQHFRQLPDGSLQGLRLPAPGSLGPVALPAAAAVGGKVNAVAPPGRGQSEEAGKEAAAQAALMASMGGGMRLTLTQREAAARQAVVLPWEQRRAGAASQDDLGSGAGRPREQAAGVQIDAAHEQQEEAQQGYGRIIYERDSETDPDSDEDPDDDLDF